MSPAGVLEPRRTRSRLPRPSPERLRRAVKVARHALTVATVIAATLGAAYVALNTYTQTENLSVGQIQVSVDPGHKGALDLYVPLVDWGVRFEDAIRLPVRLQVDLRTLDRGAVAKVANGGSLDLQDVRDEARDALTSYLINLVLITIACAAAMGLLVAFAVRHRHSPRLRYTVGAVIATTAAIAAALIILLPPRGQIDEPQYYAFGPDIPRALEAVEQAQQSTRQLDQELDAQLVGLARLVTRPSERTSLTDRPTITIASDLHNNFFALPVLDRAVNDGPLFFAGDLTDRGSPLEARLVSRVVGLGHPFVFVSGNHDSDSLEIDLARRGATVLTEQGKLKADGTHGDVIQDIDGLKVAGYSDPFERRRGENFKDRYEPQPTPTMTDAFTAWLRQQIGKVDVVMVHEPLLIAPAIEILKDDPPARPLVFIVGHTHKAAIERYPGVTVINGGSVGAGGTGNLTELTHMGIARLIFTSEPDFQPLAADLVEIDPGDGSATARRERLDEPAE
jgi:predicted phosphodiesterase